MELYKEILTKVFEKEEISINFANLKMDMDEVVKMQCYKALQKIKIIIEDESLSDKECFMRIEKIVCVFEEIGSDGGIRHDFG